MKQIIIESCIKCPFVFLTWNPNAHASSITMYRCNQTGKQLANTLYIAASCPLPDKPKEGENVE